MSSVPPSQAREDRITRDELTRLLVVTVLFLCILFRHAFQDPFYYFASDFGELYYPFWVFINHSLHSGGFPLLNPYWFGGSLPFFPLETSVFYPPLLVVELFFDARWGLDGAFYVLFGFLILHYVFASFSFYALARRGLGLDRTASLFGSVAFICSGSFVGHFVHAVYLYALPWIPLLFLFFLLLVRERKLVYAIGTAAILAVVTVAGHPQFVYYTFAFFGLCALYGVLAVAERGRARLFGSTLAATAVGVLLAACKVLPTLELPSQIVRNYPEFSLQNLYNSLHPLYYLTLLVPYLFGRHEVGYWGSELPWGNWESFLYIGIIPLLLVPLALAWRRKRLLGMFALGLAAAVVLSFGRYWGPAGFAVRHLPFAEGLSIVSKFTLFVHFFLVVVATIALHAAVQRRGSRAAVLGFFASAFLAAVILFGFLRFPTIGGLRPAQRPPPSAEALEFAQRSLKDARFLFVIGAAAILAVLVPRRRRLAALLFPIYALDLFVTVSDFNPIDDSVGPPSRYFAESSALRRIKEDPNPLRVANLPRPANLGMVRSVEGLHGYHTVETVPYHMIRGMLTPKHKPLLDLMSVKYYVSGRSATLPEFEPVQAGLFGNPSVMERVEFVPTFLKVASESEMMIRMGSPAFDPRNYVLLDRSTPLPPGFAGQTSTPADRDRARVRLTPRGATSLEVDVDAPDRGFLLFSQPRYAGWRARIDGKAATLLPADLSIYALPVPAGSHRVEFFFQSASLLWGLALSGATLLGLVLCFSFPRTRAALFTPF